MALKIIIHYNVYIYKPLQYTLYFVNTEPLVSSENEWSSYVVCYADEAVIHATIACTVIPTLYQLWCALHHNKYLSSWYIAPTLMRIAT